MKNKVNISMTTLVRYVRDLSIVIAGIAVTLYASDRVSGRSEKRDLKLYLNAIRLELEENNKTLEQAIEGLQPSIGYSEYLKSHDKDSLDMDTISFYKEIFYSYIGYSLQSNAFEMFKSSGIMRLIDDKELLLSLWEVYDEFSSVNQTFDLIFPIKWEDIKKEISMLIDGQELKVAPMYNYHFIGMPQQIMQPCVNTLKKSKEMVEKLEKR